MEHPESKASIVVKETRWHDHCCMCWYDEQDKAEDVRTIEISSPIDQGLVALSLCKAHRAQLKEVL